MSFSASIVVFLVGLLAVIMVHELGHYLTARAFGMKVEEYFLGFGPKLWSFRRGGIEYGVKAIPAGGYVKIAGMNPFEPVSPGDLPRSYGAKPRWQRALVIFAGPGTHFVLAFLLFFAVLAVRGDPASTLPVVDQVVPTLNGHLSPAAEAGLRPGDVIVGIGGLRDPSFDQLSSATTEHAGSPVVYVIRRGDQTLRLTISPELSRVPGFGQPIGRIGIVLSRWERVGIGTAIVRGAERVGTSVADSIAAVPRIFGPQGLSRVFTVLFTNAPRRASDPTSVVGVSRQVGQAGAAGGLAWVFYGLALATVFVGLLNLVPLPPFDGGHLAVLAIEKIRGKTVDMRKLIPISAAVILFLGSFFVATVLVDITKPIPGR